MYNHFLVPQSIIKFLLPYLFLYSLYILFHSSTSPGGGFQAGVIFSSGIVGYQIISNNTVKYFNSLKFLKILAASGLIIYLFIGILPMLRGSNFLNYNIFINNKLAAQSICIIIVEIGIGITVSSVMCIIYSVLCK